MEITRESLQQRYEDLVDTELLHRLRSDTLTDLAREVALTELQQRGLSLDEPLLAPAPAPVDIEFAPDHFDHNPYQAPRSAAPLPDTPLPPPAATDAHTALWWIYIGAMVLLKIGAVLALRRQGIYPPLTVHLAVTLAGVIGLVGWRLRRPLLHAHVWIAVAALVLLDFCGSAASLFRAQVFDGGGGQPHLAIGMTALQLLLLYGLARYAFFSAWIWQPRRRR